MERVLGSENVARVCEGLGNLHRAEIMDILVHRGTCTFSDIMVELGKRGYEDVTHSLVRHHINILTFSGLVTFSRDRVIKVSPLYRVDIYWDKI